MMSINHFTLEDLNGIINSLTSTEYTDTHKDEIYKLKELVQYTLDKENK